jgi:hypothetical protein
VYRGGAISIRYLSRKDKDLLLPMSTKKKNNNQQNFMAKVAAGSRLVTVRSQIHSRRPLPKQ